MIGAIAIYSRQSSPVLSAFAQLSMARKYTAIKVTLAFYFSADFQLFDFTHYSLVIMYGSITL